MTPRSPAAMAALAGALLCAPAAGAAPSATLPLDGPHLELTGQAGQFAGNHVAPAGDVNGDGRPDLLVAGNSTASVVFGPTGTGVHTLDPIGSRGLRIDAGAIWDFAGIQVSGAGDVNGDGRDDVAVGVRWDDNSARRDSGSVYVIFGGASTQTVSLPALGARGFRIDGAARGDMAGTAIDSAGDVNGDGRDDLVIGTEGLGNVRTGRSAYVVYGRSATDTVHLNAAPLAGRGFRINGDRLERPGAAVAGVGDINRDGYDDVVVGAPSADHGGRRDSGSAYLVRGSRSDASVALGPPWTRVSRVDGADPGAQLGAAVSYAGDVNGDSLPDMLLGAPGADDGDGAAFAVFSWPSMTTLDLAGLGSAGLAIRTPGSADDLGRVVAPAGDVDGDGRADILLGASTAGWSGATAAGAAYLVRAPGMGGELDATDLGPTSHVLHGPAAEARLGAAVAAVGDVTGDGRPDLAAGAPRYDAAGLLDTGLVVAVGLP